VLTPDAAPTFTVCDGPLPDVWQAQLDCLLTMLGMAVLVPGRVVVVVPKFWGPAVLTWAGFQVRRCDVPVPSLLILPTGVDPADVGV
jgi:hypothetical protein